MLSMILFPGFFKDVTGVQRGGRRPRNIHRLPATYRYAWLHQTYNQLLVPIGHTDLLTPRIERPHGTKAARTKDHIGVQRRSSRKSVRDWRHYWLGMSLALSSSQGRANTGVQVSVDRSFIASIDIISLVNVYSSVKLLCMEPTKDVHVKTVRTGSLVCCP